MNKEQLLVRAAELEITVPEGATNPEITALIKVAEHPLIVANLEHTTEALEVATKKKEVLATDLKTAKVATETATNALSTATETIALLRKELEEKEAPANDSEGVVYRLDKETYKFGVNEFRFKGEKYKAAEAVEDDELMKSLIKAKFIHLKKQ